MHKDVKRYLVIGASFGVLLLISLLPSGRMTHIQKSASVLDAIKASDIVRNEKPFVEARAALVYDIGAKQVLYDKESSTPLPLASLTKIITVSYILNHLNLDDQVTISKHALKTEGNSLLVAGDTFRVKELAAMIMVESSNDSVTALVDFIASQNNVDPNDAETWILPRLQAHAEQLGTIESVLHSTTGLDGVDGFATAFGSARDIMTFASKTIGSNIWGVQHIDTVVSGKGKKYRLKATNEIKDSIPLLLGSKTGFTDTAGGNLLIITEFPVGNPVGIIVLGSSEEGRFQDVHALYQWLIGK